MVSGFFSQGNTKKNMMGNDLTIRRPDMTQSHEDDEIPDSFDRTETELKIC
jgi:hypothetical protein